MLEKRWNADEFDVQHFLLRAAESVTNSPDERIQLRVIHILSNINEKEKEE